jgi:protoheme IX farnesyltransferase
VSPLESGTTSDITKGVDVVRADLIRPNGGLHNGAVVVGERGDAERGWTAVRQQIVDYVALTKPRIVALLVVTAYSAMVVAQGGLPPWGVTAATLVGLTLSAGGANAVNMWYDRDIDQVMERTRHRPVAAGRLRPGAALAFGLAAQLVSLVEMTLTVGWLAAVISLAGFLFYVLVYTMWLKRRTPQNIVIGGAAGAFPPLVGWAAVTHQVTLAPILMFLIIFLWTPPHFWALALYKQDDYRRANIPMMPVVQGEWATKVQALGYTLLLMLASMLLYATGVVGVVYLAAVVLGVGFIAYTVALLRERKPEDRWARRTFRYSLVYVLVLFSAMVVNLRH